MEITFTAELINNIAKLVDLMKKDLYTDNRAPVYDFSLGFQLSLIPTEQEDIHLNTVVSVFIENLCVVEDYPIFNLENLGYEVLTRLERSVGERKQKYSFEEINEIILASHRSITPESMLAVAKIGNIKLITYPGGTVSITRDDKVIFSATFEEGIFLNSLQGLLLDIIMAHVEYKTIPALTFNVATKSMIRHELLCVEKGVWVSYNDSSENTSLYLSNNVSANPYLPNSVNTQSYFIQ